MDVPRKASIIAGQRLTADETDVVERILRMRGGYVLDFSDRTIASFFLEFGVDLDLDRYKDGPSAGKANRVRSFLRQTPPPLVGQLMLALLEHGIATQFDDRDEFSPKPGEAEVDAFRRLAIRFGAGAGKASATLPLSTSRASLHGGDMLATPRRPAPHAAPTDFSDGAPPAGRRFRVALSFAGEKRHFVNGVARDLAGRFSEERILYDKFHEAEFARANLGTYLPELYHRQADLVVVVVCPQYEEKEWTGLEWRAIHDLIQQRRDDEVMLCRFERATVRGLYGGAGWVELDDRTPEDAARLILERLALNEGHPKNTYLR